MPVFQLGGILRNRMRNTLTLLFKKGLKFLLKLFRVVPQDGYSRLFLRDSLIGDKLGNNTPKLFRVFRRH